MTKSIATGLFLASFLAAYGQNDALIKQDFNTDTSGWMGMGQNAKVSLTHESSTAPAGNALQFDYKVDKGEMDAMMLPVELGALTKAKGFKFHLMADHETSVAIVLQEKEAGRYVAMCTLNKGSYQTCELSPADFHLSQDPGDPKDPDGKLDLDQVNGIGIIDLASIFGNAGNEDVEKILNVQKGDHHLYLDQFTIDQEPVSESTLTKDGATTLDTFTHPQLGWFGAGKIQISRSSGDPLQGAGMKWTYKQEPNSFVAAALNVNPGILQGTTTLSFDLASVRGGTMRVQIEGTDGNKFSTSIDIPFGSKLKHIDLNFADFRSTDDTKDPNAKLDLSKIKTLILMDWSGFLAQADADHPDNTLWISNVKVK